MIDTRRLIETPEGVELWLAPAGVHVRALAYAHDLVLRGLIVFICGLLLPVLGVAGVGLGLLMWFALEWLYPVFFEVLRAGQTPGKRRYGLRVVHQDGTPISWTSSLLRNLLRAADWLPSGYALGMLAMVLARDHQRLGDLAAGTLVVHVEGRPRHVASLDAPSVPLLVALQPREQHAILDFAERRAGWSDARSTELCDLLEPVTGARGAAGVERVVGLARTLVEER
jgi:uncharacterized RDD family membrane protein YckC